MNPVTLRRGKVAGALATCPHGVELVIDSICTEQLIVVMNRLAERVAVVSIAVMVVTVLQPGRTVKTYLCFEVAVRASQSPTIMLE